ncbi:MAG: fibA1 [Hydrocarboniphaga sp.]|uniref:M4 family metallopeptidase n=1 Tax=Hydrocarboniphaga sp. TaxID=2033016 RepID=UPI0026086E0F|nr:M4 family metallopeptidase [Hydrocarboniphaga sp.]MDB5968189.1 fibA1 [Hydrocarboniphaga sp.]
MKQLIAKFVHCTLAAGVAAMTMAGPASAARPPASGPSAEAGFAASAALQKEVPADVVRALAALPGAEIVQTGRDGLPVFVRGDLGRVSGLLAERVPRSEMGPALAAFRLKTADLRLRKSNTDDAGNQHLRYDQSFNGLAVVGGELVVHVDRKGSIYALNGTARGGLSSSLGSRDIGESAALAVVDADPRYLGMQAAPSRLVYFISPEAEAFKAYEIIVSGERGTDPVRDKVYVDADTGRIVGVHPQIFFAESRKAYSANNVTTLPGTLKRSEGQAATSDVDVNDAYDYTGDTYEAYQAFWSRDSYNNAGATLISSVHYSSNYCNAFWNSTQMVYGDGNASQGCYPLDRAVDVTAHELTHGVTENESALVYSGESGGLNEAISDIFGAFTEAWVDGGKTGTLAVSAETWEVGEDVLPPALRYMNDPAADGVSKDYWTSSVGNVDVHYSSGIANLAFYLLSQGGTHPRGKSSVQVTGVGMEKAIRIFYQAQINNLTSNSNFLGAANATVQAAQDLGYSLADQTSVANAWQAVGVAVATPGSGGGGGGTGDVVLSNGVPVTGLSDVIGGQKYFSLVVPAGQSSLTIKIAGGTGDADLYTNLGSQPTLSSYNCRPYVTGNTETCTFTSPAAGTYYVMVRAYTAYSGVTLTGTSTGPATDGVTVLVNGVAVTASGASGSAQYWKIQTPAGKKLTIATSGGTGDADLYTRFGSKPTSSTYDCRPYTSGNAETCTVASTQAGYYYVMLRGYAAYSGVSLKGSYP